jgi:hypothetical protein
MIEKHVKLDFNRSEEAYFSHLISSLQRGMYSDMKDEWVSEFNLEKRNSLGHIQTVVDWVVEENKYGCSIVWNRYDSDPSQNFGERYYEDSVPFIDFQLVKGSLKEINHRGI